MNKSVPFAVRLSPEVRTALEAHARNEGVPEADLVRGWISERLRDQTPSAAALRRELARAVAVVIAALSPELSHDDAKDLVAEHILGQAEGGA